MEAEINFYSQMFGGDDKSNKITDIEKKLGSCIKKIIEKEGLISYEIDTRSPSTNNSNYLAVLYEIDLKGKTENEDKEVNLFVKVKPPEDSVKVVSMNTVFQREMFVYNELFKIYEQMQEEANVPVNERYKMVKSYEGTDTEIIIMDNVTKKGYTVCNRFDVASLKLVEMSIKELAKFHALSFAMKDKKPEYFNTNVKTINYPFIFKEDWPAFFEGMKNMTMEFVDDKYKEKIEKLYDVILQKWPKFYSNETIKACLCHGDYRPSNIMVKTETNGQQNIVPVDYQMMHYGCPTADFFYFIFVSTDREFRKNHLTSLKTLYHETLTEFLQYFDIDAASVYPREEFEKVYEETLEYGLFFSLLNMAFMFVSETGVPDIVGIKFQIDERFRDRLRGIIEDYIEWDLL